MGVSDLFRIQQNVVGNIIYTNCIIHVYTYAEKTIVPVIPLISYF